MANGETVDRILRAATILFAERGFAETSLRTITGMADVNLAAVNYHFGTKKSLIQAVFSQFMTPFCNELDMRLDAMESALSEDSLPSGEKLLRILVESLTSAVESINEQPHRFMRLLGLAYTQSQAHLRQHLTHHFGVTYFRYTGWLRKCYPQLGPVSFYWRLNFVLGAGIFTLGSFESLKAILDENHPNDSNLQTALDELVVSLAQMFEAPILDER